MADCRIIGDYRTAGRIRVTKNTFPGAKRLFKATGEKMGLYSAPCRRNQLSNFEKTIFGIISLQENVTHMDICMVM